MQLWIAPESESGNRWWIRTLAYWDRPDQFGNNYSKEDKREYSLIGQEIKSRSIGFPYVWADKIPGFYQNFSRISQLISKEKPPFLDYFSNLEGAALFQPWLGSRK